MMFTIGHSTRSLEEFVGLLTAHHVAKLADVRTMPRSRRHPQFWLEALARSLPEAGIAYRHFPELGGLRKPHRDSINTAWQNASFRAYADHMQTEVFERALEALLDWAADDVCAIMCAEAVWWRCHRRLIADALVARGVEVRHIQTPGRAAPHELTPFAQVSGSRVTYPGLIQVPPGGQ